MAKAPSTVATRDPGITPMDRLISAMAAVVEDREMAPRIRHLFVSQSGSNLQVSLDMHPPVEG